MSARITEALNCVTHALMALPLPSDGPGKRAWASLLEAQKLLESLSTEPGEVEGWRDISTAPKDGTFIIARAGRWLRPAVVHWATYGGVAKWGGDPEGFMEEDHFMQYWTEVRYEPIEWLPLEALDALPAAPLPEDIHHGR